MQNSGGEGRGGGGYKTRCIMVYVEVVNRTHDPNTQQIEISRKITLLFFFSFDSLIPGFGLNLMKTSRFTYEMTQNRAKISDKKKRRD